MSVRVVDASVGVKWFVPEVHSAEARQWRNGPDAVEHSLGTRMLHQAFIGTRKDATLLSREKRSLLSPNIPHV